MLSFPLARLSTPSLRWSGARSQVAGYSSGMRAVVVSEDCSTTQSVSLAAKALDISYDFEIVFLTGRWLCTSVRPVFDDDREGIVAPAIVQTLRLEFLASNGIRSNISIAMDADDIKQLRRESRDPAYKKGRIAKAKMEAVRLARYNNRGGITMSDTAQCY